jgi:hypothetical protein
LTLRDEIAVILVEADDGTPARVGADGCCAPNNSRGASLRLARSMAGERLDLDGNYGKQNYLVEGLSGTGKSSVHEELVRRGCAAYQ